MSGENGKTVPPESPFEQQVDAAFLAGKWLAGFVSKERWEPTEFLQEQRMALSALEQIRRVLWIVKASHDEIVAGLKAGYDREAGALCERHARVVEEWGGRVDTAGLAAKIREAR